MIPATLKTITEEHIKQLVTSEIWHRGQQYFKRGAVLSLKYDGYTVTASVHGTAQYPYQVYIIGTDYQISHMSCTCPYSSRWGWVCKHIVAVLLAWIHERDTLYNINDEKKPLTLSPNAGTFTFNHINPFTGMLSSWFHSSEQINAYVDMEDTPPKLRITLSTEANERSAILIVPHNEAPDILLRLKDMSGVSFSERVLGIKFLRQKVSYEIRADYDEQDNLVLTPGYLVKSTDNNLIFLSKQDPHCSLIDNRWLWYDNTYAMMEEMPEILAPYFNNEKPLKYSGNDIINFFTYSMPVLEHTKGFNASDRVKNTRILSEPKLGQIDVEDRGDWFYLAPYYHAGDIKINIRELIQLRNKDGFVKKDNNFIYVPDSIVTNWQDIGEIVDDRIKVSKLHYTRLRAEMSKNVSLNEPLSLNEFYSNLNRIKDLQEAPEPFRMNGKLRLYQKAGYNWLYFLYINHLNGVLADEMGLGKTHQTMALLSTVYKDGKLPPSMIVVPTSVMDHWESKLYEYLPWMVINRYYEKGRSIEKDKPYHILLTTYNIMLRDIDKLSKMEWEYVVLDEAQKIKNYKSKIYKASRMLNAKHKLALTGTPIENRLTELWAIFDFLLPGYLGSLKKFIQDYEIPISKYGDTKKLEAIKRIIHPFKLRRLKEDVLKDLPPKIEDIRYCSLTSHQVSLYKHFIEVKGKSLIKQLNDESKPIDYIHIFALITKLKRLCDHPLLVLNTNGDSYTSGKFELFKEIMEEALDSRQKIVVFSHYLEMLSIIEQWLKAKHIGFSSLRGSTRNRAEVIKRFQEDNSCRVFVGSLMAGGLGIDLTSASVVIHYDRWWNAAREDQATDRVHRIGQKRSVQVFKLITRGTLEEKIDNIIKQKAFLMNSVVESEETIVKRLSRKEIIELLTAPG